MKIFELKENTPLEVIEVTRHVSFSPFANPTTGKIDTSFNVEAENKQIETRIFTDGEIEKESEETTKKINEFYIGKTKYQYRVDNLKTKNIYFKNHSYVIAYLIANEYMTVGNITGWFKVIKDIKVYLKDKKDKKGLKCAKQVIRAVEKNNNSVDYSTLFGMLLSRRSETSKIKPEKISNNVYSLKK